MLLSDAEISEINPDFIILDEFHRCGAQEWGKGALNLLKAYPVYRSSACRLPIFAILTISVIWQMNSLTATSLPR